MYRLPEEVPLSHILMRVGYRLDLRETDPFIRGVVHDSRQVAPGSLFVAVPGLTIDGHDFIPEAIRRGAAAIAGTRPLSQVPVPYILVDDTRRTLAELAAAFYDFPARRLTVIGVTGTDGKTTTTNLIYNILEAAEIRTGMISTVNAVIGDQVLDTGFHVTTPEAPDIQRYLSEMAAVGVTHVVIETTSHGLAQQRVVGCEFDIGVITNIAHEHLDFHGTYENYRAAKGSLFESLAQTLVKEHRPPRFAILNRDDSSYEYLAGIAPVPKILYGVHLDSQVRAEEIVLYTTGLRFMAAGQGYRFPVQTMLVGEYNVSNCLAAIAATLEGLNLDIEAVQQGVASTQGIPGRMERIELGQPFLAIVDFAHTPNALRRALQTVRQLAKGKVIAIFGSAGLRDRAKRRMMAEISAELADFSVLTAEDPRTESLDDILKEMAAGVEARGGVEGKTYWRIPDRGQAIRFGISLANPGDVVISCGKGHEQSMCFGEVEYPWDDRIAMRAALSEHLGKEGPPMPYLPTHEQ